MTDPRAPFTPGDISMLRRVRWSNDEGAHFLAIGPDVRKIPKLTTAGLIVGGPLGPRYCTITDKGRAFLQEAVR